MVAKSESLMNKADSGSGVAEEFREASRINQTSAMENCETSAFGRALASMGYGGDVAMLALKR